MRKREWSAIVAMLALTVTTACAGGDADTDTAGDTASTVTPAPEPTPPATTGATTAGAPPAGATPEMVASGQTTFGQICFSCHGADAKGTQLAPNLTDAEWLNTDGTYDGIQKVVKEGVATPKQHPAPMPAMGGGNLSDDQVKAVAAYVWSLGGGK